MRSENNAGHEPVDEARQLAKRGQEKLAGIVILVLSVAALVASLRMERLGTGIDRILGAPGLSPGLLSAILILLSILLIARNISAPIPRPSLVLSTFQQRVATAFTLIVLYILSLYWIDYLLATFLMMFAFQFGFASRPRTWSYVLIWCVLYSILVSTALYYVFGEIFYIPLP